MITAGLQGRAALVTGAASGIGLAAARLLARCGAAVAINDRPRNPRLQEAVAALAAEGSKVVAISGDIGAPGEAEGAVQTAVERLGRLDFLINNAAITRTDRPIPPAELEALTDDLWSDILTLNLVGPFRCTRAAAPHLKAAKQPR